MAEGRQGIPVGEKVPVVDKVDGPLTSDEESVKIAVAVPPRGAILTSGAADVACEQVKEEVPVNGAVSASDSTTTAAFAASGEVDAVWGSVAGDDAAGSVGTVAGAVEDGEVVEVPVVRAPVELVDLTDEMAYHCDTCNVGFAVFHQFRGHRISRRCRQARLSADVQDREELLKRLGKVARDGGIVKKEKEDAEDMPVTAALAPPLGEPGQMTPPRVPSPGLTFPAGSLSTGATFLFSALPTLPTSPPPPVLCTPPPPAAAPCNSPPELLAEVAAPASPLTP